MSSYPGEIRCRDQGHTSQRQRARLLDANPAVSLAITFATNDTAWHTLVATWRPRRLELYLDGISRASSTAAATNTSALFGIYRWGWGFSTSQDFNGDIALIACFASS
jgi:hypothetical protein